jgi:hypothetical protein
MALADLIPQTVTVRRATYVAAGGERTPTWTEATFAAAVQPMNAKRKADHGVEQGDVAYTLYFASDPGVKVRDQIVWNGRTLVALGPVMDEAGLSRVFKVAAREID